MLNPCEWKGKRYVRIPPEERVLPLPSVVSNPNNERKNAQKTHTHRALLLQVHYDAALEFARAHKPGCRACSRHVGTLLRHFESARPAGPDQCQAPLQRGKCCHVASPVQELRQARSMSM